MKEIIIACFLFVLSAILFVLSFRAFREKGFLFNNAWIYASEEERRTMDKKPHYRQSAIIFLLLGMVFLFNAVAVITGFDFMYLIAIGTVISAVIYAIVSDLKSKK